MNRFTPLMLLTLVVFSLGTPNLVWAEEDKCKPLYDAWITAQTAERQNKSKSTLDTDRDNLIRATVEAKSVYDKCQTSEDKKESKNKDFCTEALKKYNDILKEHPHTAQVSANKCLAGDAEDDLEITRTVLMTMVNQAGQRKPGCDIKGTKGTFKDDKKTMESDIEKLDEKIRKSDEELIKKEQSNLSDLEKIEKERLDAKDAWEEKQTETEAAQGKALNDMRDQQLKLADAIRTLRSQEIKARQDINSIEIEIKAAMSTAKTSTGKVVNLRSDSAIHLHCVSRAKLVNKENYAAGNSKNASSGTSRVKALKAEYESCLTELRDQRESVTQSYMNSAEHRIKGAQDIATRLSETEKMYAESVENYNKTLEKLKGSLTTAQQKYMAEDSRLANKYNQAMQRAAQEKQRLMMNKMQDQQKLQGKQTSAGEISNEEAEDLMSKHNELEETYQEAKPRNCPGFGKTSPKEAMEKSNQSKEERAEGKR